MLTASAVGVLLWFSYASGLGYPGVAFSIGAASATVSRRKAGPARRA